MLRIIVRTDDAGMAANVGADVHTSFRTIDIASPEVEAFLAEKLGLYVERRVIGVEVVAGVEPPHLDAYSHPSPLDGDEEVKPSRGNKL